MGRNRKRVGAGAVANTVGVTINGMTPAAYIDNINKQEMTYYAAHRNPNVLDFYRPDIVARFAPLIVDRDTLPDETTFYEGMNQQGISIPFEAEDFAYNLHRRIRSEISNMTEEQQQALVDSPNLNGNIMLSLALYGTPNIREQVAKMAWDAAVAPKDSPESQKYETPWTSAPLTDRDSGFYQYVVSKILRGSLEGLEQEYLNLYQQTYPDTTFEEWLFNGHAHASQNASWSAQWQNLIAAVGPNADVPRNRVPTFFPPGVKSPAPNPRYVKLLNDEYNRVQAELARRGITKVKLYRASTLNPGIPIEPWTTLKSTAEKFMRMYRQYRNRITVVDENGNAVSMAYFPEMRQATIPAKYIIGRWDITPGWDEESVIGKKENMVAGLAYAYDQGILPEFPRVATGRSLYTSPLPSASRRKRESGT